jgi:hypothetical protein
MIFQKRKIKIIKHSMWILLELVLLGAALLYGSVRENEYFSFRILFVFYLGYC